MASKHGQGLGPPLSSLDHLDFIVTSMVLELLGGCIDSAC